MSKGHSDLVLGSQDLGQGHAGPCRLSQGALGRLFPVDRGNAGGILNKDRGSICILPL